MVVASRHGAVNVWTVGQDNPRTTIVGGDEEAMSTAVTGDARTIVRAFVDGCLECHRLAGEQLQSIILRQGLLSAYYHEPIRELVITADGQKVISGEYGAIRMWNLAAPASEVRSADDAGGILSMTPDGRYQVVQDRDGTVACRDDVTGEVVELDGFTGSYGGPDMTPDGGWVVTHAMDGRRKVWDTSTGAHVVSLTDSALPPAITCDSRLVYLRRTAVGRRELWTLPLKPRVHLDAARSARFEDLDPANTIWLAAVRGVRESSFSRRSALQLAP